MHVFTNIYVPCIIYYMTYFTTNIYVYNILAFAFHSSVHSVYTMMIQAMDLLLNTKNCVLRMRREFRERFPRHRLQRKPLVSDPGMHHSSCVTHVPWWMSGSVTVPGIPGAYATRNFTYRIWQEANDGGTPCAHFTDRHLTRFWFSLCMLVRGSSKWRLSIICTICLFLQARHLNLPTVQASKYRGLLRYRIKPSI